MNLNELFADSEREIKEVQKLADLKKQELHKPVLLETARIFSNLGWKNWSEQELLEDGQYSKLSKAIKDKMEIVSIDYQNKSGQIQGSSIYDVSGGGCTCKDFLMHGLPCKHMYLLALKLYENN